jgi:hypothetical protein
LNGDSVPERDGPKLVLENRHTGERLALTRMSKGGEVWLELNSSLPPRQPPLCRSNR